MLRAFAISLMSTQYKILVLFFFNFSLLLSLTEACYTYIFRKYFSKKDIIRYKIFLILGHKRTRKNIKLGCSNTIIPSTNTKVFSQEGTDKRTWLYRSARHADHINVYVLWVL